MEQKPYLLTIKEAAKRLGIPRIAIYATRHMAISHLQSQGVEIGTVAKIAGHASPQVTLQYYTNMNKGR